MKHLKIRDTTRTVGEAQGYEPLHIRDDPATDEVTGKLTNMMLTAWRPTHEQLQQLNNGGQIVVSLIGKAHPPINMFTTECDEEPDAY